MSPADFFRHFAELPTPYTDRLAQVAQDIRDAEAEELAHERRMQDRADAVSDARAANRSLDR